MIYLEIARLMVGLMIAGFHRPIADYMLERERATVILFRERGFPSAAGADHRARPNLYFCIGIVIASAEMVRMYMMQRGIIL